MTYSSEMQATVDSLGIKDENVLYLPIARVHLDRIRSKEKRVEFRDATWFYLKKLCKFDKNDNFVEEKPITHILFQAGYNAQSPRLLVSIKDWFVKEAGSKAESKAEYMPDAEYEGFTYEDEYLALVVGDLLHEENF